MTPESLAGAAPAANALLEDVLHGLQPGVRKLPPKYFYDDAGARLFERITTLPEYYPTRTEPAILRAHAGEMADAIGTNARIVEFGSGSGDKTRVLLRQLDRPAAYVPVDIARMQLHDFARDLRAEFPSLRVDPVCADYMRPLQLPAAGEARTVAFFPGSTIGNLEPLEAQAFLRRIARLCGPGGGLLLGTDLHKDAAVLEPAYNDAAGVTAAFNRNMLTRINRELGADFDVDSWRHHALYDTANRRIEMRLVAERDMEVRVPVDGAATAKFVFAAGEWITTEYSHKYSEESVHSMARETGWEVARAWIDPRHWFGVWFLTSSARR